MRVPARMLLLGALLLAAPLAGAHSPLDCAYPAANETLAGAFDLSVWLLMGGDPAQGAGAFVAREVAAAEAAKACAHL